eukprot:365249-Chlamydomonas_euryale.AAC.24
MVEHMHSHPVGYQQVVPCSRCRHRPREHVPSLNAIATKYCRPKPRPFYPSICRNLTSFSTLPGASAVSTPDVLRDASTQLQIDVGASSGRPSASLPASSSCHGNAACHATGALRRGRPCRRPWPRARP